MRWHQLLPPSPLAGWLSSPSCLSSPFGHPSPLSCAMPWHQLLASSPRAACLSFGRLSLLPLFLWLAPGCQPLPSQQLSHHLSSLLSSSCLSSPFGHPSPLSCAMRWHQLLASSPEAAALFSSRLPFLCLDFWQAPGCQPSHHQPS